MAFITPNTSGLPMNLVWFIVGPTGRVDVWSVLATVDAPVVWGDWASAACGGDGRDETILYVFIEARDIILGSGAECMASDLVDSVTMGTYFGDSVGGDVAVNVEARWVAPGSLWWYLDSDSFLDFAVAVVAAVVNVVGVSVVD